MNALVLGAGGQLGRDIVRLVGEDSARTHQQVSITDAAAVEEALAARRPEVVFNCAAYNAVDRAESEPAAAFAINAQGPRNIALACARHGAGFVHFSTNFVFDGTLDRPYVETDEPAPLGVYARSKLEGERAVLAVMPSALVVRTAAVYGGTLGHSFPERILERARSGAPLRVVADQRVNPTCTVDLAQAALELARRHEAGIVHAVADGCCGWDELARAVVEEAGLGVAVESVSTSAYPTPAARPPNGCLSSLRQPPLRPWRQALEEWVRKLANP
ncbi:MAG TPA: dTDP-4-dehydrorhamnose reductase [Candidatus Udaeobacter sp.]|nr:dTDP-4-dehydrorhamnose reductase [Candidatus Udaeobacter sp.]